MKSNQKGFSVIEILIVIVVVGLVGTVGWLVYDRQKNKTDKPNTATKQEDPQYTDSVGNRTDYKTFEGLKYTVPKDWKNAEGPIKDSKIGNGAYLLSPDYNEAGGGQLNIVTGAYINFSKLEWVGIDSSTTQEQAVDIVKNGEGGYIDSQSAKITAIGNKQVVMFNSGHTTDGVTVFYKTSGDEWLEISFSTPTGEDGNYNAQDSPHYQTFLNWLEEFIKLN